MNLPKLLTIMFIIFTYLQSATAFTTTIHEYAVATTFEDSPCIEQLKAGSIAPTNSALWATNQDFLPANWTCIGDTTDCQARQKLQIYYGKASHTPDACQREYLRGIASFFYLEASDPTEKENLPEGCKTLFGSDLQNKITNFDNNFLIKQFCTFDNNNTTLISYSYGDWNYTLTNLKKDLFIDENQIQTQETIQIDQNIIDQATQITAIIKQQINQKPTPQEIEVTTNTLIAMNKYYCFEQPNKKNDLYETWKKFDPISQTCLKFFLNGIKTDPFSFGLECPSFAGNAANYYTVQSMLDNYFQSGFGERDCQRYSVPQTVFSGGALQQQQFGINYCTYTPKHLLGCVQEFENQKKTEDKNANDSAIYAVGILLVVSIFGYFIISIWAQKG